MKFLPNLIKTPTLEESDDDEYYGTIAVSAGDRWFGYVLAWSLLELQGDHKKYNVRVISRVHNNLTDDLHKKGAEIVSIDYGRSETLETALGHVGWLVFVSEMAPDRVKLARALTDAAKKVDVSNIITISMLGAGDSKAQSLVDFRDIERAVESSARNWVTLRNSFLNQRFFHFERRIKENSMLTISVNADSRWAPIDLDDLVSALSFLAIDDNGLLRPGLEDKHQRRIYTLTGPELVSGPIVANEINLAIKSPHAVKFSEVTREDLEDYLLGKDKGSKERNKDLFRGLEQRKTRHFNYPKPAPLNPAEVTAILDFFDYVKSGRAGYLSGDVKAITNEEPKRMTYFFRDNSDSFRPNPKRNNYRQSQRGYDDDEYERRQEYYEDDGYLRRERVRDRKFRSKF